MTFDPTRRDNLIAGFYWRLLLRRQLREQGIKPLWDRESNTIAQPLR